MATTTTKHAAMSSAFLRRIRTYSRRCRPSEVASELINGAPPALEVAFRNDDHVVCGEWNVLVLAASLDDLVQVDDQRLLPTITVRADDLGTVRRRLVRETARQGNAFDRGSRLLQLVRPGLLHLAHDVEAVPG